MATFDGKVALVTGASSGIGRATALAFAAEGARVVIGNRRTKEGAETIRLIKEAGGEGIFFQTDVSSPAQVEALVNSAIAAYGQLDFACNNASVGAGAGSLTHEILEADWAQSLAVNLTGTWLCMKYELKQMLTQGAGVIVNMSSVSGVRGNPAAGAAYSSTKHGIIGLTKTAALENARTGIRINALCPGVIDTPIWEPLFARNPSMRDAMTAREPVGRMGTAEEVANAVMWLCSPGASFVTGSAMLVDGGLTA